MAALAIVWDFCGGHTLGTQAYAALCAQGDYDSSEISVRSYSAIALGRALRPILPEDIHDRQPLSGHDFELVADVRLDNRTELLEALGGRVSARESDASLVARAYEMWRERFVDFLVGDYAIAIWDKPRERLVLVRDPSGQRPLHFTRTQSSVVVGSTPMGLLEAHGVDRGVDFESLACFVADLPRRGAASFFRSIFRVQPGEMVFASRGQTTSRLFWQFPAGPLPFARVDDYVEAFRERLDAATTARLRGAGAEVGTHLSSGADSSAVTATAARLLSASGRVVAFTSAPPRGFSGPVPVGRAADESEAASTLAKSYPNIRHIVVRAESPSPLEIMRRDAALYGEPLGLPCNQVWWSAIHEQARERKLSVMLTGESGNYTISAGGIQVLSRYLAELAPGEWVHEVRSLRHRGFGLPGLLAASFGPWVARPLWRVAMRRAQGATAYEGAVRLLQPPYRRHVMQLRQMARGERPPTNEAVQRWRLFQTQDPGNFRHGVLRHWGLDERDVASDRRLAELMLSLPRQLLLSEGETRRLARLGLADRAPSSLWQAPRGYQGASWYQQLGRGTLLAEWGELKSSAAVKEFLDVDAVEDLINSWPDHGYETGGVISTYRLMLLRLLSAAHFAVAVSGERSKNLGGRVAGHGEAS